MRGTTLIETLIYLSLLSILMFGVFSLVSGIGGTSAQGAHALAVEEEGRFVIAKIRFALMHAKEIIEPERGSSGTLVISQDDPERSPVTFSIHAHTVAMKTGSGEWIPLTSTNVDVSEMSFVSLASGSVKGVAAAVTISDRTFTIKQFFHE